MECPAGDVIVRRQEPIRTAMQREPIAADSIAVNAAELAAAQHVLVRAADNDTTFADLLALLDSDTLSCLLAGSVVVPETCLVVPWNGVVDGRLDIVAVDSATTFSTEPKRIDARTVVEIAAPASIHRFLNERDQFYNIVAKQFPEQTAALHQLIDLIADQYVQRTSVGVIVTGPDADAFVDAVAEASGLDVSRISISDLFSARRGQAERRLQTAWAAATSSSSASSAVIVVRDLHLLQNSAQSDRLRFRLEHLLDELQQRQPDNRIVVVLAPSEAPASSLPPSLRRGLRLDHVIPLRALDRDGRRAVLQSLLAADQYDLTAIADKAHGFVRGDLQRVCLEAALMAFVDGAAVIRAGDFAAAVDRVRPSFLDDTVRPSVRPRTVLAGVDSAVARLRAVIQTPLQHPQSYRRLGIRPPRGVLLYGPSGVGKTAMALNIAAEANAAVLEARGCDLISAVVGASEKAIRDLFQRARALAPTVVVLDQVEMLAPRRDRDRSQTFDRVLSCLLMELDGVTSRAPDAPLVFVIGTTSFRDRLDDAILRPGRFDEQIEIGLPDLEARRAILSTVCRSIPLGGDVDLDDLARRTAGMSGADLQGVCIEAAMNALRRDLQAGMVTGDDFDAIRPRS